MAGFNTGKYLNSRPATRPGNANVVTPDAQQPQDPRSLLANILSPKYNPMPHTPPPPDAANRVAEDQGMSAFDRMAQGPSFKLSAAQQAFWGSLEKTAVTPLGNLARRIGGALAAGGQWAGDKLKEHTSVQTVHDEAKLRAMRPGDVLPPATRPAASVPEALKERLNRIGGFFGEFQPTLHRPGGVEKSQLADFFFSENPDDIRKALSENSAHLQRQPMQFTPKPKNWAEDPSQILHDILGIPKQVQPSPVPQVASKGFKPNVPSNPLTWAQGFQRPGLLGLGMNYLPGAMQTVGDVSDILAGTSKFRSMR